MTASEKKVEKYLKEKRVFPLVNFYNHELWGAEGETGMWEVRYDKLKNTYICNCKNVRNTNCVHIKTVIKYKENKL